MLRHSLGGAVIFNSLQHFILSYLTYCPACKSKVQGIAIRAVSQVGQNKRVLQRNKICQPKHVTKCFETYLSEKSKQ